MAVNTYKGVDGDWENVNNWTLGSFPTNTETVVIPPGVTQNLTTNLDQGGVDLGALIMAENSTVAIGASGGPLKIAADLVWHRGLGNLFYETAQNAGSALDTDLVIIQCGNSSVIVELGSEETDAGGMDHVILNRCNATIKANMGTMAVLDVGHVTARETDVALMINADAGALTDLFGEGGRIKAQNAITNAHLKRACELIKETVTVTNTYIGDGCKLRYELAGTLAIVKLYAGGMLDLTRLGKAITITDLFRMPGSQRPIITKDLHTVTNEYDLSGIAA